MTPEQAVAWLTIEGWLVGSNHSQKRVLFFFIPDRTDLHAVRTGANEEVAWSMCTGWVRDDFEWVGTPYDYPQHAAAIVDLILKGETS